jgi:hypothetical protein
MAYDQTDQKSLSALIRKLGKPEFDSPSAYLSFCYSAIAAYRELAVQTPQTPLFQGHLLRINSNLGHVIKTSWGGVDIEKHEHPVVEKFLVVQSGRFLAYEKHEQKVETLNVKEGHGLLVFRPDGSNNLQTEALIPGYTRTLQPNHEHTIIALSDLLVFESSIDPKGMDQDLIFIYEPS